MRTRSKTFRSLLLVSLAMILCVSLFFGSTAAWFVDSTGVTVNTFTMGKLNAKVYTLNYDAEHQTYTADGGHELTSSGVLKFYQQLPVSQLLFEPGATFSLPVLYVKNFSSFPINFKLRIMRPATLPAGDYAPFYDVLKFYAKVGDQVVDLSEFEGQIAGASTNDGVESDLITIYVHMDEAAGNEYMNKQVSGLQIQFYLYQQEGAGDANVGDTWYISAGEDYRLVGTDGSVTNVRTGH